MRGQQELKIMSKKFSMFCSMASVGVTWERYSTQNFAQTAREYLLEGFCLVGNCHSTCPPLTDLWIQWTTTPSNETEHSEKLSQILLAMGNVTSPQIHFSVQRQTINRWKGVNAVLDCFTTMLMCVIPHGLCRLASPGRWVGMTVCCGQSPLQSNLRWHRLHPTNPSW
jgi:hypothetical protein